MLSAAGAGGTLYLFPYRAALGKSAAPVSPLPSAAEPPESCRHGWRARAAASPRFRRRCVGARLRLPELLPAPAPGARGRVRLAGLIRRGRASRLPGAASRAGLGRTGGFCLPRGWRSAQALRWPGGEALPGSRLTPPRPASPAELRAPTSARSPRGGGARVCGLTGGLWAGPATSRGLGS